MGYGQVRRKDLTGSVSTVKATDIVKSTDMSLNGTLQGRAAGVSVVSTEGAPGADVSISIRAGSSISAQNDPLYIIDGFPSLGGSNLNINPNDIESVEILKDASATAIYGSRGANGVIIITTKSGKAGKFSVNYDAYYSVQQLGRKIPVLNSLQYAENQHYISASPRNSELGDSICYNWPTYKDSISTNYQDKVYRLAGMQSHNLSFTGGTENLKMAGSFNLTDQNGIAASTSYKRYSGRLNVVANINKVVTSATDISVVYQDRTGASLTGEGGLAFSAVRASPYKPPGVDVEQYLAANGIPAGGWDGVDPLVDLIDPQIKNLNYFASVNSSLSFKLLQGLTFKISGGMNYTDAAYNYFYPSNTSEGTTT
ncbi:MAG: TonB-dependent receptor plug domain-containing protein, partial [Ginsengibacter sp.]